MQDGYLTGTVVRDLGNKEKLAVNRWGREQVGRASRRQVGFVCGGGEESFQMSPVLPRSLNFVPGAMEMTALHLSVASMGVWEAMGSETVA